jgi:hypothetical protein
MDISPRLGDPAPWFGARTIAGAALDLHVDAGRWVVLALAGASDDPPAAAELAPILEAARAAEDDHLVAYVMLAAPPGAPEALTARSGPGLAFVADYDGGIAALFGGARRTVVLDPMLRVIANIAWETGDHNATLRALLASLPAIDASCGVALSAPALIVPRVLDFALCDLMVKLYDQVGGEDSGFLLDRGGRTATVIDHRLKQRRDLVIALPELKNAIRDQLCRRLLPAVARYFQFAATRMDRYIVSCYDSASGGHFFRHRDNENAGAAHRRFAVSINLNGDYDGCDLVFPEFGRRVYRAPSGGAIVFSCGALHEVTPIRRGRRYAFLPFLYNDDDAARRFGNNRRLEAGEAHYLADDHDRLVPAAG